MPNLNRYYQHLAKKHSTWYSEHMQSVLDQLMKDEPTEDNIVKVMRVVYETAFYHGCKHGDDAETYMTEEEKKEFVGSSQTARRFSPIRQRA